MKSILITFFILLTFQLTSAQNALGGGGRYDSLINQFGGPELPAVGFAAGINIAY